MKLYNIDKVIRREIGVLFGGKQYLIKEPNVQLYGEIMAELEEKTNLPQVEAEKWLISKMAPDIPVDEMFEAELDQIARVALTVLRGGVEGKKTTPLPKKKMMG